MEENLNNHGLTVIEKLEFLEALKLDPVFKQEIQSVLGIYGQ